VAERGRVLTFSGYPENFPKTDRVRIWKILPRIEIEIGGLIVVANCANAIADLGMDLPNRSQLQAHFQTALK
jgi:hypothetical protein